MSDHEHEHQFGLIRLQHEGDRSDEFKEARGRLVASVNDWLAEMLRKRGANEPLADGTLISDSPRITRTDFGPNGPNTHLMAEEREPGVAVTGDNHTQPIALEAVRHDPSSGILEVIEARGTDPIARQVHGKEYSSDRRSEVLAAFSVRDLTRKSEREFAYSITGDGEVRRKFINEQGGHASTMVQDASDLELAQAAFEQVTQSF